MAPTGGLPVQSSLYPVHWSPHLHKGGEAAQGCSGLVGGGGGSAFRMWTAPLKPDWKPPRAAGASAVALHQSTVVSWEWMSLSGLSSPVHTCIPAVPLDDQHLSPQSTLAQSENVTVEKLLWTETKVWQLVHLVEKPIFICFIFLNNKKTKHSYKQHTNKTDEICNFGTSLTLWGLRNYLWWPKP